VKWFLNWYLVIALAILCFGLYEQGARLVDREMNALQEQITQASSETKRQLKIQESLKREIQSQNDPAWVELVLIRCLGLVPEGSTKVYFSDSGEAL
jgi:hypothetical protein